MKEKQGENIEAKNKQKEDRGKRGKKKQHHNNRLGEMRFSKEVTSEKKTKER